jgi:ABC-type sugar transport system ATPase subunit
MIYVTHDQVEAMTLADKIVVLNAGNVEQVGTPLELYHHPRNAFVAGFIGSPRMNFLAAEVVAADPTQVRVRFAGDLELDVPADGSETTPGESLSLGLRPEHLVEGGEGDALFRGTVEVAEHLGEATYLYVHGAGDESVLMKASGDTVTGAGDALESGVSANACYLFDRERRSLVRSAVPRHRHRPELRPQRPLRSLRPTVLASGPTVEEGGLRDATLCTAGQHL